MPRTRYEVRNLKKMAAYQTIETPLVADKPAGMDQVDGLRVRWIGGRRGRGQLHLPEDPLSRGRRGFEATLPLLRHSWLRACRDAVSPSPAPPL